eukprot:4406022-Prorocentrum_lima.AAC.1
MRNPIYPEYLCKKEWRVATARASMRNMLERRQCPGNRVHQHMPIEGLSLIHISEPTRLDVI